MNLTDLLSMYGLDVENQSIKLVRHQQPKYNLKQLYEDNMLEFYQSIQSKDVFGECDYIVSFLGVEQTKAMLIGVYKVVGKESFNRDQQYVPQNYPYTEVFDQPLYYYQLERVGALSEWTDRLIIEWGNATRNWHQWLSHDKPKEVIEVLPKGYMKDFPGYDELILSFNDLSKVILHADANRIWHTMLSAVSGIYLITDLKDGAQYVGSAYGKAGILGRWKDYVSTHHGGNKKLVDLLSREPERYKEFRFSILRTLPKTLTPAEVIAYEGIYKEKLGTRAFGLNDN